MADAPQLHPAEAAIDKIHGILEQKPLDTKALDEAIEEALEHKGAIENKEIAEAIAASMREKLRRVLQHDALKLHQGRLERIHTLAEAIDATRNAVAATGRESAPAAPAEPAPSAPAPTAPAPDAAGTPAPKAGAPAAPAFGERDLEPAGPDAPVLELDQPTAPGAPARPRKGTEPRERGGRERPARPRGSQVIRELPRDDSELGRLNQRLHRLIGRINRDPKAKPVLDFFKTHADPFYRAIFGQDQDLFDALKNHAVGGDRVTAERALQKLSFYATEMERELRERIPQELDKLPDALEQALAERIRRIRADGRRLDLIRTEKLYTDDPFFAALAKKGALPRGVVLVALRAGSTEPITAANAEAKAQERIAEMDKLLTEEPAKARETAGEAALKVSLNAIESEPLREAVKTATETDPEARQRLVLALMDATGLPRLETIQKRREVQLYRQQCLDLADGSAPALLAQAIANLNEQLKPAMTPDFLQRLGRAMDEKALRDQIVAFYITKADLAPKIKRLVEVLSINPNDVRADLRPFLTGLQTDIKKALYDEIPEKINPETKGKNTKEKIGILDPRRTSMREAAAKFGEVQGVIDGFQEMIDWLMGQVGTGPGEGEGTTSPAGPGPGPAVGAVPPPGAPGAPAAAPEAEAEDEEPDAAATGAAAAAAAAVAPGGPEAPRPKVAPNTFNVGALMRNVLEDATKYDNLADPVSKAIGDLLQKQSSWLDMNDLEAFLKKPDVTSTPEVQAMLREAEGNVTTAGERVTAQTMALQLKRLLAAEERALRDAQEKAQLAKDTMTSARGIDAAARERNEEDWRNAIGERNKAETRINVIKQSMAIRTGERKYETPREVLVNVHLYIRKQRGGTTSVTKIQQEVEKAIGDQRPDKGFLGWTEDIFAGGFKPFIPTVLKHLAKHDDVIQAIGEEKIERLAKIHKAGDVTRMEGWIASLGGNADDHYRHTVPRLIAYLKYALEGSVRGNWRYLSWFSRGRAQGIIDNLNEARNRHVQRKLRPEVEGKDEIDKMLAYFREIEEYHLDQNQVSNDLVWKRAYMTVGKNVGITAAGALTGGLAWKGSAIVWPFLKTLTMYHAIPGGLAAGAGVGSLKVKQPEIKKGLQTVAKRGAYATAGVAAGSAIFGMASGGWLLPFIVGGALGPEVRKLWKWWRT